MKLSSNSVGMLIFFALATAIFVLMTLRPSVQGSAMNFGMPISSDAMASSNESTMSESVATKTEKTEESNTAADKEPSVEKKPAAESSDTEGKESSEEAPAANDEATSESTTTN